MSTNALVIELTALLEKHNCSWEEFRNMFLAPIPAVSRLEEPKPETSEVDAKFVHATCEAIINSKCKLTRGGKEFVIQLRERASQYKSVRFSPKQWSWFNSIMVDAGVDASEMPF
jgi:hypothetical protein